VKFDEFRVAQPIKSRKTFSNAVALVAIITLILPILIIAAWLIGIEPKALADSTLPR
jgi:type IV secretory pathway component VirB8